MELRSCIWPIPVVFFCTLSFVVDHTYGGDLEKEARRKAEQYILGEKFALENYLMVTDVIVATSPDAEFLFESRGSMTFFRREGTTLSSVAWQPKVLDDLRIGKARLEHIPFASFDSVQELAPTHVPDAQVLLEGLRPAYQVIGVSAIRLRLLKLLRMWVSQGLAEVPLAPVGMRSGAWSDALGLLLRS